MKKLILLLFVLIPALINAQIKREREIAFMHYLDQKYSESFKEYSYLAQFGNSVDLEFLAQHYHYGFGTEQNIEMAKKFYKMAADLGEELSQAQICELIYDNIENASDQQKSELYKYSRMFCTNFNYSSSTNMTDDNARYSLYLCYKNGWGVQKNPLLADIWLAFAAYNDAMKAQDEFCSIYGIDGDYDSDEEEQALLFTYFKHLYKKAQPYIQEDKSVEACYFKIFHLLAQQTTISVVECLKETISLYENPKLSNEGKAFLYDMIEQFARYNTELKEKFSNDADKYELVSDEEKNTWHHVQLTKMVWKVDVMLNKTNSSTGTSNEHKWIDLGLPSGTKWSTCNIGAETPNATGSLFAWAETKPKRKYTLNNYSTDRELLVIDNPHDVAKKMYGDSWTVPSCENWRELFLYCDIEYDASKNTITVTSPNKQKLVLPLVQNSEKDGVIYWTNTCIAGLYDPEEGSAAALILEKLPDWGIIYANKWRGCPIRPIYKK